MADLARDVMETHVITVDPDLPLLDAHRLFVEEEIHGAPVVDDRGEVLGILSSADLLRAVDDEEGSAGRSPILAGGSLEEVSVGGGPSIILSDELESRLREVTVGEVMTAGGVTVSPDTSIEEVAGLMRRHRIHRVPVVSNGSLAGIITTFDLIALLEKPGASG
jgi:CBS domain-containing protein